MTGSPESNVEFVPRLWQAFESGGAEAMIKLVPREVEWRPSDLGRAGVPRTWGTARVRAGQRRARGIRVNEFPLLGDDVLVHSESATADGAIKVISSRYQLSRLRLVRAQAFESEREALATLA